MENKEVEQMLNSIKVEYALLEGKLHYQSKDVEKFLDDNQLLTKQVHELKQQLQAKDKALDKACESLYLANAKVQDYKGNIHAPNIKDWKEWCENETN